VVLGANEVGMPPGTWATSSTVKVYTWLGDSPATGQRGARFVPVGEGLAAADGSILVSVSGVAPDQPLLAVGIGSYGQERLIGVFIL
jgi:hypothetical protein